MNIFYLDNDPTTAAQWQCDRHVVKMILESAQLLSTAHREVDGDSWADEVGLYKRTHKNHPSAVWARSSAHNYHWLFRHFTALCDEYTYRYGKTHLSDTKFRDVLSQTPNNVGLGFTEPPQCMPDEYKVDGNSIQAYRNYYSLDKASNDWFCYNKNRCRPWWLKTEGSF